MKRQNTLSLFHYQKLAESRVLLTSLALFSSYGKRNGSEQKKSVIRAVTNSH